MAWGGRCVASTEGLEYPLARDSLEHLEPRGISNVLTSDDAHITLHEGSVLVVTPVLDFPRLIGYATASPER